MFKKYLFLSAIIHLIVLWGVGVSLPPKAPGNKDSIILEFNLERPQIGGSVEPDKDKQEGDKAVSEVRTATEKKRDSENKITLTEISHPLPADPTTETEQISLDPELSTAVKKEEPLPFPEKDSVETDELSQLPIELVQADETEFAFRNETLEQEEDSGQNLPDTGVKPNNGNMTELAKDGENTVMPEAGSHPSTAQEETGTYKEDPAQRPILVQQKTPFYPLVARRKGWEGTVTLQVNLDQNGSVGEVQVLESSGYEILDKEAVKAVRHWRYTPAYQDGNSIDCQIKVKITFTLQN